MVVNIPRNIQPDIGLVKVVYIWHLDKSKFTFVSGIKTLRHDAQKKSHQRLEAHMAPGGSGFKPLF
jgi:hypothetical protein